MRSRAASVVHSRGLLLFVILLLGHGLLLRNSTLMLWSDEAWSAVVVQQPTPQAALAMITEDFHPPLYFLAAHVWQGVAGDSVFALRYFSMLMTLLGAAVLACVGRRLFDANTALLAAGLYLLHDLVQTLGAEVRPYALAMLLTVLVVWCYERFLHRPTPWRGLLLAMCGAALLWTLYWGGFVLLTLAIHAALWRPKWLLRWVGINLLMGVLYLPWLPQVVAMLTRTPDGLNHTLAASPDGYQILAYQLLGVPELFWAILALAGMFSVRHEVAGRAGGAGRGWALSPAAMLIGLVIILTLAISVLINVWYPSLSYRALSLLVPLLMLLVAHALANFRRYERLVMSLIVLALSLSLTASQPPPRVTAFPALAAYLFHHRAAAELVVSDMQWESYQLAYELNRLPGQAVPYYLTEFVLRQQAAADLSSFPARFAEATDPYSGVWVIGLPNFSTAYRGSSANVHALLVADGYTRTAAFTWPDAFLPVNIARYDRLTAVDEPRVFANGMMLMQSQARLVETDEDGRLAVSLWWRAVAPITESHTVSVFLLDAAGRLAAQHDSPPLTGFQPTDRWLPGETYYDAHSIETGTLPAGQYRLGVKVYRLSPEGVVTDILPEGCADAACVITVLDQITVGR